MDNGSEALDKSRLSPSKVDSASQAVDIHYRERDDLLVKVSNLTLELEAVSLQRERLQQEVSDHCAGPPC